MSPAAELVAAAAYCVFLVLAGTALAFFGRRRAHTWPDTDRGLLYRGLARVVWLLAVFVIAVAVARQL